MSGKVENSGDRGNCKEMRRNGFRRESGYEAGVKCFGTDLHVFIYRSRRLENVVTHNAEVTIKYCHKLCTSGVCTNDCEGR